MHECWLGAANCWNLRLNTHLKLNSGNNRLLLLLFRLLLEQFLLALREKLLKLVLRLALR